MCGIIGVFGKKNALKLVKTGLEEIKNRGLDGEGFYFDENGALGHCLHSVVNTVEQPIIKGGVLIANCEIYKWEELNKKYKLNAKNDSEVLACLLDKFDVEKVLRELDGVYAFAYLKDGKLILARDLIGVKPLWYSEGFSFASEKKALEKIGILDIVELNPRRILVYENKKIKFIEREFFKIEPEIKESKVKIFKNLTKLIEDSIKKRIPKRKFGVLFSGGVDSSVIALVLKKLGCDFTCYTAAFESDGMKEAEDVVFARKAAEQIGVKLKIAKIKEDDMEKYLKKVVPLIEDSNVVKVGVALPFYLACEQAKKDGCKVIFSGLGTEEIFAGYERHKKALDTNKECVSSLLKIYERNNYRDDVITMNNNLELRLPFLDKKLVEYGLRINPKFKVKDGEGKAIFREIGEKLGLSKEIAWRKKKAAQYGSNFQKGLKKFTKKKECSLISECLKEYYPYHNLKLGALVSSGKDSIYAMFVMMRQNYEISCMISLISENKDSYMFHTPNIEMVKLQSEAIGLPLIEEKTKGEKEEELEDMKKALEKAKKKYGIKGIVVGALWSNYQRERVEKIADSLGLKIFAPLWHKNQEQEVKELLDHGFKFIITKVMAEGLNKKWLNKEIGKEDLKKLVELDKKIGFNVSGEGGEFETLMVDGPIFKKKIEIVKSEIREESENVAELIIKKARLVNGKS